jgi:hypothetical protein
MKKEHQEQLNAVMTRLKSSHPHLTEKQIRKAFLEMKKETEDSLKAQAEVKASMQTIALAEIKRVAQSLTLEDIGVKFCDDGAYAFLNIRFGTGNHSWWGDFSIAEPLEMQRCKKRKIPTPKSKLVLYTDGTVRIEKKGNK